MANNFTLTMLKPDAIEKGSIGNILKDITNAGFTIIALKLTQLTQAEAQKFYEVHKERPFFNSLVEFMTSGPIVAAVLKKDNAVEEFRKLIGSTNPQDAEDGTLRKKYAESLEKNAVHGSDSDENANIEAQFHFADKEIYSFL